MTIIYLFLSSTKKKIEIFYTPNFQISMQNRSLHDLKYYVLYKHFCIFIFILTQIIFILTQIILCFY